MGFIGCSAVAVRKFLLLAAFLIKPAIEHFVKRSATRDFKNSANIYKDYKHNKDTGKVLQKRNSITSLVVGMKQVIKYP